MARVTIPPPGKGGGIGGDKAVSSDSAAVGFVAGVFALSGLAALVSTSSTAGSLFFGFFQKLRPNAIV
jgi:hypothetical protein